MPLQPIAGLKLLILRRRKEAMEKADLALACKDPRDRNDYDRAAEVAVAQAQQFANHVTSDEELIASVEVLVNYLHHSNIHSRYRSLALTCLEEASGWLRREIGDEPSFSSPDDHEPLTVDPS